MTPAEYDAWYETPRGRWVSDAEFRLMTHLLQPQAGQSLLDAGCGTGHFTRRFANLGLHTTGLDVDPQMIFFARKRHPQGDYLTGSMTALPFADGAFDLVTAITSLCFIEEPVPALQALWRVCRGTLLLGLLNRHSLLYRRKHGHGTYRNARWDTVASITRDIALLDPQPMQRTTRSAVFTPGYAAWQRRFETMLTNNLPFGGFLAVCLRKQS